MPLTRLRRMDNSRAYNYDSAAANSSTSLNSATPLGNSNGASWLPRRGKGSISVSSESMLCRFYDDLISYLFIEQLPAHTGTIHRSRHSEADRTPLLLWRCWRWCYCYRSTAWTTPHLERMLSKQILMNTNYPPQGRRQPKRDASACHWEGRQI